MRKIDETGLRIIRLLQNDARQSNAAIARAIGVSEATIRRRIRLMVEDGSLSLQVVLNPSAFGFNTSAIVGIDVLPDLLDQAASSIAEREEVIFLGVSTGRYDLIAGVSVGTLDDLKFFLEAFLAKAPGIRKIETLLLLDVRKRSLERAL